MPRVFSTRNSSKKKPTTISRPGCCTRSRCIALGPRVLGTAGVPPASSSPVSQFQSTAFNNLFANRDKLNAYTRALLALAAHNYGYSDKAKTLIENLENGVKVDSTPDTSVVQQGAQSSDPSVMATAHWGEDGIYWRWSDGGVEATSFALRALLAIDPQNKLIEPVSNWLIKNRRGAQWSNTRDTAIVVLTLNDYLRTTRELEPQISYELLVNGSSNRQQTGHRRRCAQRAQQVRDSS